jgi:hypothetical protein
MPASPPREIVLVHSPLVGPSSFAPTAEALERRGFRTYTPCVVGSDVAWRDAPGAVLAALPELSGPLLVGHSAAGLLLPALAGPLNAWGLIFLDARMPPAQGPTPPAEPEFHAFVKALPVEQGRLPKWSQWWGPGGVATLIPNQWTREAFEADLPRLRPEWFDDAIETPPWEHLRVGYLQTSPRLADQAAVAGARGWPLQTLAGTHLDPFLRPGETALAISELVTAMSAR